MSNPNAGDVIDSLPSPMPSSGIFTPVTNIGATAFSGSTSTSYSATVLDPAQVIGTIEAPYVPMAQPAYTATLYQNVFDINNNLQNDIQGPAIDNRDYPTSYAVQAYVQSQISGSQLMGTGATEEIGRTANTSVVNTIVTSVTSAPQYGTYTSNAGVISNIAVYEMDGAAASARIGATKQILFQCNTWLNDSVNSSDVPLTNLIFLYAGTNSNFMVNGIMQKYYQVTHVGDFLSFILLPNVANNGWVFMVTGYQSLFSNAMTVTGGITPNDTTNTYP